jgi:hypothetical protein
MCEENQEVEKKEEVQEEAPRKVVKISEMLGRQGDVNESLDTAAEIAARGALNAGAMHANPSMVQEQIKAQIANNQELYTTLSRSILELHNDMRGFRQKTEGLDRVIFSLQQGMNKGFVDLTNRLNNVEKQVGTLTELWNQAVATAEKSLDPVSHEEEPGGEQESE